jgi:putative ABC transport system substrate-binding protein
MNRRKSLFALLALVSAPLSSFAQQPGKVWRLGFLYGRSRSTKSNPDPYLEAFLQGLRDNGYVVGRNLEIDWRFADGNYEHFPALANELVKLKPDVIVTHNTPAVRALKEASSTIPIVFASVNDPVGSRLVKSLSRPGGNITRLTGFNSQLLGKRV